MTTRKIVEIRAPPGIPSVTSFTLTNRKADIEASSSLPDVDKLQKSLKQRPWILHDQIINKKPDVTRHPANTSLENTLPKGVISGCPSCKDCQKITSTWRPEESCRPVLEYAPVFHPTESEFKDVLQYIAKIRPKAEEYGICRIIPPDSSWKPPLPSDIYGDKWKSSRISTQAQQIDELKDLYSKRKLKKMIEQVEGDNVLDGFEFECGPEFTLRAFQAYEKHFKGQYLKKKDNIFTDFRTPLWENVEGEYWRIIQNPTEQIQVLSGHNLDIKVIGSGFPLPSLEDNNHDHIEYKKSPWNLNNTPKLPGSLLAFDYDNSTLSTPRLDVGMCFSSICWKVEEHNLYTISYMHEGASRTWYGIPSKYNQKCESLLKKTFPELSKKPELFHKLVTQLPPTVLKSEGISVFRCVQHPKQFVVIFPGAYYSGFDTGFSVSEKVNFAPVDWLPHGQLAVKTYSELHRKTLISYDKMLIEGAHEAIKSQMHWKNACGKDGWLTRALKSRVRLESNKREFLCNASQSRKMEGDLGVKRECIVCFSDLYLSAAGCTCSPDKYTCLEHSKQLCTCPWSSRVFLFRYEIHELNLIVDGLEGKGNV